ncbi:5-oxoprolinase/urea amidolyase family protein [Providencia burhodogranariea]|uniref:Allophanate hydrolase subunit 1 and 2 n=1 Tax=Providencia burhodogranariea DSM 19968 TaxID=1141662 RepID=K8WTM4_9GAMM|nr:5-oxoprolinase/urea amidolyase family protein [Providencia burhodogranariea]EKT63913.1 allophanate hydrolase subunit 1 and 2 [Providencia burhodogranariea DSM 19968]
MRFLPVNLSAFMVELQSLEETMALTDLLRDKSRKFAIEEITPAARTVLVRFNPAITDVNSLVRQIAALDISITDVKSGQLVTIPVHYNGEDLVEVAEYLGISVDEVIRRHTSNEYQVAFCGFAPGFAYMVSKNAELNVPRRQSPRIRIPAGSVALAGEFSSIYPQASPGGWQLIGVTDTAVWDIYREEPALLKPGYRVSFVDASKAPVTHSLPRTKASLEVVGHREDITVLATGLQTLLQDSGRIGQAALGISESGAMDKGALRSANRLVGNAINEVALEITQGGFKAQANCSMLVAATGATCEIEITTIEGVKYLVQQYQPIQLAKGDIIRFGRATQGVRSYLAIRGGIEMAQVLGSCSFDTLAQVGPLPITTGQTFAMKSLKYQTAISLNEPVMMDYPSAGEVVILDVVLGPRTDWFTVKALQSLTSQLWQVTAASNRIGLRLQGETPLEREKHQELPSEGTCVGAIQIPANGQPVLFLNDHPLTGGYPVIGAVCEYHLDLAGQIPVNAKIQFNPIGEFKEFEGSRDAYANN